MEKSQARMKWLPVPDGPITVHHRRDVSAVDTGEVLHFGHHHECAPGVSSPSYSPADLIRVSVLVRQHSGQAADVRLRVRASDGVAAREIYAADFPIPIGYPVNLVEIRGFLTQNPYEVFLHHRDGDPIVFDYWVGVGYCCGQPAIVQNDELSPTLIYSAVPLAGTLDISPLTALLSQISNNQLSGNQLARVIGESRQGGSYFDQVAGVVRVADFANDIHPRGAVSAVSPYEAGAYVIVNSPIFGSTHSLPVPPFTRVQRIVVRSVLTSGVVQIVTSYGTYVVPVPGNANGVVYEFQPRGRAATAGAVSASGLGTQGMLWVECTKDP